MRLNLNPSTIVEGNLKFHLSKDRGHLHFSFRISTRYFYKILPHIHSDLLGMGYFND